MKRFLLIFLFCLQAITMFAQTVAYKHKNMSSNGGVFEFSAYKIDSVKYLVVRVSSDGLTLVNNPQLLLKVAEGDVVKLVGKTQNTTSESGTVLVGNIAANYSEIISTAIFEITDEQIEKLKDGVMKIRLTTIPVVHEKEFKRDKIGRKLYDAFLKVENDYF